MGNDAYDRIEEQLTVLLRRSVPLHLATQLGHVGLERSAYGILCQLVDEGPQPLGVLAGVFGLTPSTLTRQAQDLERAGFVARKNHPSDRRVFVLHVTGDGRRAVVAFRRRRLARLRWALSNWPESDLSGLGRLLKEFNVSLDRLGEGPEVARRGARPSRSSARR